MSEELQKLGLFENDKKIADYPEKQQIDYFRDGLKFTVSLIPTGSAILDIVFTSPISKRKDVWARELSEKVQGLLDNGLSVEDLQNNEKFIDVVFQTTQIAIKTSQKQKIDALKNAVVNTALDESYDASIIQIFLNLIDELTPLHFNLLANSKASSEFEAARIGGLPQVSWLSLERAQKLYENVDERVIRSIFSQFAQQGLFLKVDRAILTDFGERFMEFIKEK
jgi:hypothetical protein